MPLALAACDRGPRADAWFPLAEGHRWTYRVTTATDADKPVVDTLTIVSLPPRPMPDARTSGGLGGGARSGASGGASGGSDEGARVGSGGSSGGSEPGHRRSADGVDYWLRADASGIYRVARQSLLDAAPVPDTLRRYVLKAPYTVGTEWQAPTTAYLLARRFDRPREVRHTYKPVPMSYRIEATGEAVETPAGRHAGCLRVRGTASIRVYTDPVAGWRDMPLTTTEWYCPGPGLVKVERTEPVTSPFMTGGSQVLELEAFR